MLEELELRNFKCFESLRLSLAPLTLLSGTNASGKSSVLHSLTLLHQTMRENENSQRLTLNGSVLQMGTLADVVSQTHGRDGFGIELANSDARIAWDFEGDRRDMSLEVAEVRSLGEVFSRPRRMRNLIPTPDIDRIFRSRQDSSAHTESGNITPIGPNPVIRLAMEVRDLTYLTAEREGPRDIYSLEDQHSIDRVGPRGENAVSALFSGQDSRVAQPLRIENTVPTLLRQTEARLAQFFPGCSLNVQQVSNVNAVTLGIRVSEATDFLRPIHCGFGITQVLPIIVAALYNPRRRFEDEILIIENPEVHLHPAGQALMGQFLAEVANSGRQVIVETHSDHVLNGIRRAVRSKKIESAKVAIFFFRQPSAEFPQVLNPIIDESGNIDMWPDGFFDQFDKDIDYFAGWSE